MIGALVLAVAAVAQPDCVLTAAERITAAEGVVRLRDIVDLACLSETDQLHLADLSVVELPDAVREQTLDRSALVALIRRRAPLLDTVDPNGSGTITVVRNIEDTTRAHVANTECFVARRPIVEGASIQADDVASTACLDQTSAPLSYDRGARLARAGSDIVSGDYLGEMSPPPAGRVDQGEEVSLAANAGVVSVNRTVTTLQAADFGSQAFVRAADGTVFSATLSAPIQQVTGQ